jgi:hypothetical protein
MRAIFWDYKHYSERDLFWTNPTNSNNAELIKAKAALFGACEKYIDDLKVRYKLKYKLESTNLYSDDARGWLPSISEALTQSIPYKKEKPFSFTDKKTICYDNTKKIKGAVYCPQMRSPKDSKFSKIPMLCIGWFDNGFDDFFEVEDPKNLVFLAILKGEWGFHTISAESDKSYWVIKRLYRGIKWIYNPYGIVDHKIRAGVNNAIKKPSLKNDINWNKIKAKYKPGLFHKPDDEKALRVEFEKNPKSFKTMYKEYRLTAADSQFQPARGCPIYPLPQNREDYYRLDPEDQKLCTCYMIEEKLKFCDCCGRMFHAKRSDARACSMSACKKALSRKGTIRMYVYKKT